MEQLRGNHPKYNMEARSAGLCSILTRPRERARAPGHQTPRGRGGGGGPAAGGAGAPAPAQQRVIPLISKQAPGTERNTDTDVYHGPQAPRPTTPSIRMQIGGRPGGRTKAASPGAQPVHSGPFLQLSAERRADLPVFANPNLFNKIYCY